ncbi:MAG TPA: WYL domain-containing protein [Herpetosiphonaceae bacterium]|nr:WYL domain-containing protein [Herpetosiphonaceae bacterium]
MNRLDRMAAILMVLQNQPRTAGALAQDFEVSRRTVLRDVQALCEIGVPIIAREGVGGGYSLPDGYALAPLPLTGGEAFLLALALKRLEDLPDVPFLAERASLAAKVGAILPALPPAAAPLLDSVALAVPERSQRTPAMPPLVEAMRARHWIRIDYQSAERRSIQHILPRALSEQQGFWYCHAYACERGGERTYRVDRILAIAAPAAEFAPPALLAVADYHDDAHPEIRVELTSRGVAYVESEPHLGPAIERLADGGGRLAFRCPPGELAWYARYFASLGPDAHVTAPAELRQRLRDLGAELVRRYANW